MLRFTLALGLVLAADAARAEPAGLFRDAVVQAVDACRLSRETAPAAERFAAIGFTQEGPQSFVRRVQGQTLGASLQPSACVVSFTTLVGDFEPTLQAIEQAAAQWTPALKTYDYRRPFTEDGRRGLRTSIGWQAPDQSARQRLVVHEPEARAARPQYLIIFAWEG